MSHIEQDQSPARRWNVAPREEMAGQRSTRRKTHVVLLKYLLFGLSALMVLAIIVWPQFAERQNGQAIDFAEVAKTTPSSTMTNARFVSGGDKKVNVTAEQVVQDANVPELVHLTTLAGDTTTNKGTWMHLSANTGQFNRESAQLTLNGDVALFTDEGNEFHAADAVIKLNEGEIDGGGPVTGHGPFGRFEARRFAIRENGNVLLLSGDVKLVIEPGGVAN
ncbi:LPS export ABC transporter periplasmic protein LptC [Minwuia sp.]|uniref:LPS export ABC transporter periplasmic protein LptC n=1 Tax=Minwuia sp. TaxID=2493630 RepID=UPI003A8EC1F6